MNHDRYLPGLIAIIMICLVLVLWLIWFVTGSLPIYVTTQTIQLREDGMLLATFPAEGLRGIAPGQNAELLLPLHNGKRTDPIQGEVMNVPDNPSKPVEVFLLAELPASGTAKGQLKILVRQVTPAVLIWNSIQK
jgi:hypothetical protein